jgi:predicted nucleic acid-binding protein
MENDIIVDSNVFIDLLNRHRDPAIFLLDWAGGSNLATCGMVRLEVLRGIKSLKQFARISAFMDVMVNVPSDNRLWVEATDLAWQLDRKGMVIPGADVVIAASALRIGAAVLTTDAHFQQIDGLRVITPPAAWFGTP